MFLSRLLKDSGSGMGGKKLLWDSGFGMGGKKLLWDSGSGMGGSRFGPWPDFIRVNLCANPLQSWTALARAITYHGTCRVYGKMLLT
jgi:hypothetical protein